MHVNYPLKKSTGLYGLSPSIHWAQRHQVRSEVHLHRRIYDFELLYLIEGDIEAEVGDQSVRLSSGSLLYLPSGVYHKIRVLTLPFASFLGIHFDYFNELFITRDEDIIVNETQLAPERFCYEPSLDNGGMLFLPMYVHRLRPQVVSLMEQLIQEFNLQRPGHPLVCNGLLLQLFGLLRRAVPLKQTGPTLRYTEAVLELSKQMEEHCEEDWSNERLARELCVHEDYGIKLFREVVGVTPNKYLQQLRHQRAKQYLRETDWTMATIAHRTGYADEHYFSRVFKKLEGLPPRDYRLLALVL
ncbi:helix-turn-helix transcriptional regulator [Paenibacillus koleovorans]|uniref:helix-turn-helix transcriptional regulator n=1 Tax=Paenibacillus koleovorans TaxID=121608 RepID=UPI000FD8A7C3|nr:helix-turn-helix domain-containing protein [Paenibacillus koleovorans]